MAPTERGWRMAGLSRNKGKAGERELVRLLKDMTGHNVRRRVRQPGW